MIDNFSTYGSATKQERHRVLISAGIPYFALAFVFVVGTVVALVKKVDLLLIGVAGVVPVVILVIVGFIPFLYWPEEKKIKYVDSKLYREHLRILKKNGHKMSKEEIDRLRFKNDPMFREEVIQRIHAEEDERYATSVANVEEKLKALKQKREQAVKSLAQHRWKPIGSGIFNNEIEGTIKANGWVFKWNLMRSVEMNNQAGVRTESVKVNKETGEEAGNVASQTVNLVKDIADDGIIQTEYIEVPKEIPTCNHLSIRMDMDGTIIEVNQIVKTVDQSSMDYTSKLAETEKTVEKLKEIMNTPVPEVIPGVEEDMLIKEMDIEIAEVTEEAERVKADVPDYTVPSRYLS